MFAQMIWLHDKYMYVMGIQRHVLSWLWYIWQEDLYSYCMKMLLTM